VKALLRAPGLRRLLIGQTISALGDWMGTIAVLFLVPQVSGSSAALGGVLVVRLLPGLLAGPLAARATARWGRRRTMLVMDAVRAGMVILLPVVSHLWWIYVWSVFIEAGGLVFLPARDAALPRLVEEAGEDADLQLANGLVLATSYGTIPLGAGAFFGLLYLGEHGLGLSSGYGAYLLVFAVDAVTYLASFLAIAGISKDLEAPSGADEQPDGERAGAVEGRRAHGGVRVALSIPLVRTILPAVITVTIGVGALFSVGVKFIDNVLKVSGGEFAALIACFGVGAALGLAITRVVPQHGYVVSARIGVFVQGGVIAAMSLAHHYWIAILASLGFGAGAAVTLVSGMSLLQTRLFGLERDLGFAVFHVTIRVGLGLAALAAGAASDSLSSVKWPLLGTLPGERVVLLSAGLLVLLAAAAVKEWRPRAVIPERETAAT
jgi:predicted MFS family arabinose efflux permease